MKPTCSFRNNDQTETNQVYPSWKTAPGHHPTHPPSSLLGFFFPFYALVPQINNMRLILKHLWCLGELLIMKFGYTIWVNIWLRTAKALCFWEKLRLFFLLIIIQFPPAGISFSLFSVYSNPNTPPGATKSLLAHYASSDFPAHLMNPNYIYSQHPKFIP